MAPLLFKDMKGVNFSCTAPASTAVCSSINSKSIVQSTITCRSSFDSPRIKPLNHFPKPSSKPKQYSENSRKSLDHRPSTRISSTRFSTSTSDLTSPAISSRFLLDDITYLDVYNEFEPSLTLDDIFQKPKKLATIDHFRSKSTSSRTLTYSPRLIKPMKENKSSAIVVGTRSKDHELLMDTPRLIQPLNQVIKSSSPVLRPSDSANPHHDQVVVLRVSLHCKGCEGKVRKHISKMEGVTSFNIDFKAKKVTIMGDITPLGVLNSVSKVKNAQFWPSPPHASTTL